MEQQKLQVRQQLEQQIEKQNRQQEQLIDFNKLNDQLNEELVKYHKSNL